MKMIIALALLTTAFAADGNTDIHIRRNEPSRTEKSVGEKIVEKIPQAADSIAALMEKAPDVTQRIAGAAENLAMRRSNVYIRMNVMEPNVQHTRAPVPGLGVGFRRTSGSSAVDFFAGYSRGVSHHRNVEFITLPKISYLYYFTPISNQSLYAGPAVAFGRIRSKTANTLFEGLIPSASIGYELSRRASMLSFFQLDVSLPIVASRLRGPLPGVVAELAFGAGF